MALLGHVRYECDLQYIAVLRHVWYECDLQYITVLRHVRYKGDLSVTALMARHKPKLVSSDTPNKLRKV